MKLLSRPVYKNHKLKNVKGAVEFYNFMDQTFDLLNSSKVIYVADKPLLDAIQIESEGVHIDHWNKAIKVFESMQFVNKITKTPLTRQPPCVYNWVFTLKS